MKPTYPQKVLKTQNRLYFHIGFPKCMSTYFQHQIFKNSEFNLIGKPFDRSQTSEALLNSKDFDNYYSYIEKKYSKNHINIVSDENFTKPFNKFNKKISLETRVNFFKNFLTKYEIYFFLITRDEINLIYSNLIQSLRKNKIDGYKYSLNQLLENIKLNNYDYFLEILNANLIKKKFYKVYNQNNFHILNMENVFDEKHIDELINFFQIKNKSEFKKLFKKDLKINQTKMLFKLKLKLILKGISKNKLIDNKDLILKYFKNKT